MQEKLDLKTTKLAFKILRRNYGCPGADGLSIKDIKANYDFHQSIVVEKYTNSDINKLPIKQVEIIDFAGKKRKIYVYCLYERWLQLIIKLQIEFIVEKLLPEYVFGYRRGKDMSSLQKYILSKDSSHVLYCDIVNYFENIDTNILLIQLEKILREDKGLIKKIRLSVEGFHSGLSAGNALSTILSNVYLSNIDKYYSKNYARFSDDMYFATNSINQVNTIKNRLVQQLADLGLDLNTDKFKVVDVKEFQAQCFNC